MALQAGAKIATEGVDGFIVIEEHDYIHKQANQCLPLRGSNLSFYGRFMDTLQHFGEWTVADNVVPNISDANGFRYVLYLPHDGIVANNFRATKTVFCEFETKSLTILPSFSATFSLPEKLCVNTTSIERQKLSKTNDLTFNWTPDEEVSEVFVAICTPGIPCIVKNFDDNTGSATIPAGAFAGFPSGADVFINIGRGLMSLVETSNNKNIAIIRVQWGNLPGIEVE
jgi:hypothetical protein